MPNKRGEMSEDDLLHAVIDLAHMHGWRIAHFRPAQTQRGNWVTPVQGDGKGFPDLVLTRGEFRLSESLYGRLIFAELKSKKGHISDEQQDWLMALSNVNRVETYVWRPPDLPEIAKILK